MTGKIIEITVTPTGETKVETKGFTGASCRDASRLIEQALGKVQADTPTPEFHRTSQGVQTELRQRG